jgi:hypothetical protein
MNAKIQINDLTLSVAISKTFGAKLFWAAIAAAIFIAVSLPQAYNQTSRVTSTIDANCPTPEGKFIHAALFFAVNYFIMKLASSQGWMGAGLKSDAIHAKYSLYATLLFFLVASSDTYRLTGKLISGLADNNGCPEIKGVIVHGLVFMVLLILMMYLPMDA